MLSGAIPRMRDSELATSIASWPTAVEDLSEEQKQGYRSMIDFFASLSERMPMAAVYAEKLKSPTIRGTKEVVESQTFHPGSSQFKFNPQPLYEDHDIESELMMLMILAQSARAEATVFAEMLDRIIDQLDSCLQESRC